MITTSKKINLEQLDKELGSKGLCSDFNDPKNKIIKKDLAVLKGVKNID